MPSTITPNMGLIVPTALTEPGPTFATDINTSLGTLDTHNHTSGKGVLVPTAGLNINADLSFTGFGPINQLYSRFTPTALPSPGVRPDSFFVDTTGNLWYENSTSNQIQITAFSAIAPSGTGLNNGFFNFGGTGYAGVAQAGYNQTTGQYLFYKDIITTTLADMVVGKNLYIAGPAAQTLYFRAGKAATTGGSYFQSFSDTNGNPNGLAWHTYDTSTGSPGYTTAISMGAVGYNNVTGLGVNIAGNAVAVAYQGATAFSQSTTIGDYEYHDVYSVGAGAPSAGFGARQRVRLATAAAALGGSAGLTNASSLETRISNATGPVTSIALRAASAGALTATAGIDISGVPSVGIMAAAGAINTLTVGGSLIPASTNVYNIGSSGSVEWAGLWAQTGVFSTSVSSALVLPTSNAAMPAANVGGLYKNNQVLAWALVPASGTGVTAGYNTSVIAWSGHTCTITLLTSIAGSGVAAIVTPYNIGAVNSVTFDATCNGSTIVVNTFAVTTAGPSITGSAQAFQVIVIGPPA